MTISKAIYYGNDGTCNMLVLAIRVKLLPDYSVKLHIIKLQWQVQDLQCINESKEF